MSQDERDLLVEVRTIYQGIKLNAVFDALQLRLDAEVGEGEARYIIDAYGNDDWFIEGVELPPLIRDMNRAAKVIRQLLRERDRARDEIKGWDCFHSFAFEEQRLYTCKIAAERDEARKEKDRMGRWAFVLQARVKELEGSEDEKDREWDRKKSGGML